jgi:hypothetical protein
MITDNRNNTDIRFNYDSGSDFNDKIDNDKQEGNYIID